jgi:hypothetical protein
MRECLEYIYKCVNENPLMSEDELYGVLINSKLFTKLGYKKFGKDVRAQRVVPGKRKKADYVCRDEYQNAVFVLEAKRPSHRTLSDALSQLWNRYVLALKARYGVLTNGWKFVVYKKIGENPERILTVDLSKISKKRCDELFRILKKPEYDVTLYSRVQEYFSSVEKLSLKTKLAKEDFFATFQLEEDSAFGSLLTSLVELFDFVYPKSKFLKGAYGFWQRSLARKPKKIPDSWAPFLKEKRDVFRFMFCLESAHALLARLIVAKACEDLDFPGISVSGFTLQKIHQVRGQIPLVAYPLVLISVIREMRDQLVYSLFEDDIFGWWRDGFTEFMQKSSRELLWESVDKRLEDFSNAVAKVIFMLYKFDFGEVAGDPLGDLYQQYFDRDTRKALGEFYTPVEVVNYILDAVGYENIGYRRLLDPACGSGTFIVEALKRYLTEAKRKAKQHGWAYVLRELCNSPKILGFDIHPFACLIARTRFMLELIPYLKKALEEEAPRIFYLQRIPVFRTDSLAIETIPPEFQMQRQLAETEEDIVFPVTLPMKINSENSMSVSIILPSWRKILMRTLPLYNLDEYFCTLQAIFDAVKNILSVGGKLVPEISLKAYLKEYLTDKDFISLANFFKPYADHILREIKRIQSEFEDGRLVKSIEDGVLASLLKNYLQYDFVVGNPPYVRLQRLSKTQKNAYKSLYTSAYGKFDLYILFIERGIRWLAKNGRLGFITSDQFMYRDYGKKLRQVIPQFCLVKQILDFGASGVFQDVANYPSIIVLEKNRQRRAQKENIIKCIRIPPNVKGVKNVLSDIKQHIAERQLSTSLFDIFENSQHPLNERSWKLMPPEERKVFKKIMGTNPTLEGIREAIFGGVQTGADKVYLVSLNRDTGSTVYVTPQGEKEAFVEMENRILKKILKGENVRRWTTSWDGLCVIYPFERRKKAVKIIPKREMRQKYPLVLEYLLKHKTLLESRKWYGKKARELWGEWYALMYTPNPEFFEQPKILTPAISKENNFAYDESGFYFPVGGGTVYGIILQKNLRTLDNYLYLLGTLNSKVLEFFFKHITCYLGGGYREYHTQYLRQLPIVFSLKPREKQIKQNIIQKVKAIARYSNQKKLLTDFPDAYLSKYEGIELDEYKYTFKMDHRGLVPILSGQTGKGFVVYPSKGEEFIWLNTKKKAQYLVLALKNRNVKQDETVNILIPRDNSVAAEILERLKKTVQEIKATRIDQLEEEINELVYQLYGLNEDDKAVIEDFLKRF